jgi:hypothetical protein
LNEAHWARLREAVFDEEQTRFVVLEPLSLTASDLSF